MIYCNLKGGLGNMLFQIAETKSLSIDNNTECSFPNIREHLNYLNKEKIHNPKLSHSLDYLYIIKDIKNCKPKNVKKIVYPFNFVKLENITCDVLIDGFFQSEKYFLHNRNKILEMFDFVKSHNNLIKKYNNIFNEKTTSIHVRRGDYLKFPNIHLEQKIEYFNKSIDLLKDKTEIFVIFSDDISWCKKNLNIKNSIYIENEKDYNELYLMSICNNNIITNSSFSWWGAWLNKNKDKIVIAPKNWFGNGVKYKSDDIIPKKWIKI